MSQKCHKIKYRKVRRFWPLHAKKIELYLQCQKKPADAGNMRTGTLPKTVLVKVSLEPSIWRFAHSRPDLSTKAFNCAADSVGVALCLPGAAGYARHTVTEALWTAACRRYASAHVARNARCACCIYAPAYVDRNARCFASSFQLRCWHCMRLVRSERPCRCRNASLV